MPVILQLYRALLVASLVALTMLAVAVPVLAQESGDHSKHGGGLAKPENASPANRAAALRIHRRTLAHAHRYATVGRAQRAGYRFSIRGGYHGIKKPGFYHMRFGNTTGFTGGSVFNARRPASLVFWCSSNRRCKLAAFMYRAPGQRKPPSYGNIMAWHKHKRGTTWVTHDWTTRGLAEAFARCAPFEALRETPGIVYEPFNQPLKEVQPCPGTMPEHEDPDTMADEPSPPPTPPAPGPSTPAPPSEHPPGHHQP